MCQAIQGECGYVKRCVLKGQMEGTRKHAVACPSLRAYNDFAPRGWGWLGHGASRSTPTSRDSKGKGNREAHLTPAANKRILVKTNARAARYDVGDVGNQLGPTRQERLRRAAARRDAAAVNHIRGKQRTKRVSVVRTSDKACGSGDGVVAGARQGAGALTQANIGVESGSTETIRHLGNRVKSIKQKTPITL